MFNNRKIKKLEAQYAVLIDEYEDLFEESECASCEKYNNGNVDAHIDRFKECFDCSKECGELKSIARRMDDVINQIDNL